MIISTKGRYGLRAIFELAAQKDHFPLSIKTIAKRQHISETYLEQIFSTLKKHGLIKSVRGAYGGYVLARKPAEITVKDVLVPLEGPLAPADCVVGEACEEMDECATRSIWFRIYNGINDVMTSISLQDMVDDYAKIEKKLTR